MGTQYFRPGEEPVQRGGLSLGRKFCVPICAVLLCASLAQAEVLCGNLCDPSELVFQGVRHFQTDSIRDALAMDIQYQTLCAPQQPLKPCLDYLAEAVVSGYANAGMPVSASATVDEQRRHILVSVTEGALHKAGKVVVEGTRLFTAEEFQKKLAEATPETTWPDGSRRWATAWVKGEPAPLDRLSLNEFALRAQEMFGALGRLEMDGSVTVRPGDAPGVQELRVLIRNEGIPLTLQSIEVKGAVAVPAPEIVERSGLQTGQLLTLAALKAAYDALRETAQFSQCGVQYLPGDGPGMAKLVIQVKEQPWARPLSEKPSDVLVTLQRMRQWINQPEKWEEELVLERAPSAGKGRIRVCWKPTAGLIAELNLPAGEPLKAPLRGTLILNRTEVTWVSALTKAIARWKAPGSLWVALDIRVLDEAEQTADSADITFLAGFTSGDFPPFYRADMTPEAVYAWRNGWTPSADGKLLSKEAAGSRMTLDAATGKLVSAVLGGIRVTLEKEAYDAARARTSVGAGDVAAPFALARDILYAALQPKEDPTPFLQALSTLTARLEERFRPLPARAPAEGHPFRICTGAARAPTEGATYVLLAALRLFPTHSTPWAILHDTAMLRMGRGGYRESVERLHRDPRTGPLGLLMLSAALQLVDAPLSAATAEEGLKRCNWDAFDREMRVLAEGDTPCARAIAAALAAGADLSEEEWAGFVSLGATPSQRSAILAVGRALRENRRARAPEALSETLKLLWSEFIRPALRRGLKRLSGENATVACDALYDAGMAHSAAMPVPRRGVRGEERSANTSSP